MMTSQTTSPRLTPKFSEALAYVYEKHGAQLRKGGDIPYLGHLLTVAGFVIDADGTEAQAIAALLHDAAEDQGGEPTLAEIRDKFGDEVADIVDECSDTVETPKPPWRERKQRYVDHLPEASTEPSWFRWPISCTTRTRSCVTSARMATSCGNGSTSRTRSSTC